MNQRIDVFECWVRSRMCEGRNNNGFKPYHSGWRFYGPLAICLLFQKFWRLEHWRFRRFVFLQRLLEDEHPKLFALLHLPLIRNRSHSHSFSWCDWTTFRFRGCEEWEKSTSVFRTYCGKMTSRGVEWNFRKLVNAINYHKVLLFLSDAKGEQIWNKTKKTSLHIFFISVHSISISYLPLYISFVSSLYRCYKKNVSISPISQVQLLRSDVAIDIEDKKAESRWKWF